MSKYMLAAGAAALAFTMPALAGPGGQNGHGQGGGQKQEKAQKGNHGGGEARAHDQMKAQAQDGNRGNGHAKAHGNGANKQASRHDDSRSSVQRPGNGNGNGKAKGQAMAKSGRSDGNAPVRYVERRVRTAFVPGWDNGGSIRGFAGACPPGLAMKNNGCLPPGQAKNVVGTALPAALAASVLGGPYSQWYRDDDRYYYRWDNDYIYRVQRDGGLIDALFPAIDRDYYYYPVGYEYPSAYNYYNVPYQYQSYYPNSGDWAYRYGDGAIYRVDPRTSVISGIASLLAGDLSVGQPLPTNYSVYNVPMSYRDRYYDTADNWYRYNDGYIYRVDPTTQLVTAVINAIV